MVVPGRQPFDADFERKARDLFLHLIDLPPDERAVALAERPLEPRLSKRVADLLRQAELDQSPNAEPDDDEDHVPRTIGHFTIIALLGRSPTSSVYLARTTTEGDPLALKILAPRYGAGDISRRFRQEREILARLDHPGIARLLDHGTLRNGASIVEYIATRYIPGDSIRDIIEDCSLNLDARFDLLDQLLEAAAYAHAQGVIHRDLKPENLKVTPEGQLVVLDFGVSRLVEPQTRDATLPGQIVGTLRYMSPEQLAGDRVGRASDLYTIGMIAYEILTGDMPYDVPDTSLYRSVVAVATSAHRPLPAELRSAYPGLQAFLSNALSKSPDHRYPDAEQMRADLERVRTRRSVPRLGPDPEPAPHRRRAVLWSTAVVAVVALLIIVVAPWRGWSSSGRQPTAVAQDVLEEVTAASQLAIQKLHLEPRSAEATREAIERLEAAYPRVANLPGDGQVLAWLLTGRLGEAWLILGMLTASESAYVASVEWYQRGFKQENLTAAQLQDLPDHWRIRDHFAETGLHTPAVGIGAAREGLASLRDSDRNLHQAVIALSRACARLTGDSPCFPASVSQRARDNAIAIAHNDRARVRMRLGAITGNVTLIDEALVQFAAVDTMTILPDRQPLAHASFLLGIGEAFYRRFRLTAEVADLDSARVRLRRAREAAGPSVSRSLHVKTSTLQARSEAALTGSLTAARKLEVLNEQIEVLQAVGQEVRLDDAVLLGTELLLAAADLSLQRFALAADEAAMEATRMRLEAALESLPAATHPAPRGEVLLRLIRLAHLRGERSSASRLLAEVRDLLPIIGRPSLAAAIDEEERRAASAG